MIEGVTIITIDGADLTGKIQEFMIELLTAIQERIDQDND